jgi:UDP-glucose 4-epimerase
VLSANSSGQPFTRWGSDSTKDYLHGSDCFRALDLIVRSRLQGLWNIASGRPTRLSELVSLVETTTQLPITITNGPPVPWDVSDNRIDPSRFIAATGWNPLVSLETGLQLAAANI